MKSKKLIAIMVLIVILIAQISIINFNNIVYATQSENAEKFHYKQLNELAKKVYDGIYDMYKQGILKTGIETFDLAKEDKYVSQEQLENYMKGSSELKTAMNAARYAFYADNPEVFYVNFQNLTVRVTKDSQNRYHANIGSGNLKSYYVDGFTSTEQVEEAITSFEARVNEIAEAAKDIEVKEGKNIQAEQIKYVHNEIINNTSYRLEDDCKEGDEGFIGTPYGAIVKKQAVCEGYARALKTILDKVGINSILVQGTHQSDDSAAVPHMWNYVQIDKETKARNIEKVWYAVDATLDDPFVRQHKLHNEEIEPGSDIVEGFENTRYCLVGNETMNREHVAIETVEAAGNYVFRYPELYNEDYNSNSVYNEDKLLVKYKQEGTQTEEYQAGDYYVSYNGKGYIKATEEGKYIIMKTHYYQPGDGTWQISPWAYLIPGVYAGGFEEYDDHIYITVPNSEYVEFAVTTLAPGDYENDPKYLAYQGDESDFVAQTGKLDNPSGTFKAKPYIKTQTPAPTSTLTVGPTYHIDVTYDDDLVLKEGVAQAGYRMESTGATGTEKSEITNFVFDGKRRVTFDLKFSKMYADDGANYKIYLTGLVGKNSKKEPMEIYYGASNPILCSYRMNKAKNWEVFGRPTLIENQDLSMNGWQTSDGESVSDKLKNRIALVTTKTTQTEKEAMTDLMEGKLPNKEDLITSETYNISLNVCKKYVVKTGHRLRISLGFPAGYGPEDSGVTFKAYHFSRNDKGEVTGIDEIPCVVTPYGLIVTCNSFSPFAIAVTKNDGTEVSTNKSVIVSAEEGGVITGANREEGNIINLTEGETKNMTVQADEGYEIEKITICGKEVEINQEASKETMNITVGYDDVKDGNTIISATFVAKTVKENEETKGEEVVEQQVTPATATIPSDKIASLNESLEISANVGETEGTQTYQWYKDGIKLEGKNGKTLTIESVTQEDTGKYTLKVTTTIGTVSEETQSNECTVTIRGFEISMVSAQENVNLQKIEPGKEFKVKVNMQNLTNIGDGIVSLIAQLEYDKDLIEKISIKGEEGWNLDDDSLNEENLKFITDNGTPVKQEGGIITITFKAKDTITEKKETSIKLKGIQASGGYGVINVKDANLAIAIEPVKTPPTPPEKEKIISDVYVINEEEKDISKIEANTTIAKFKENVETKQEMIFIDKDGNTINEDTQVLATGTTLKVGKTLQYTLIVTGDIDGDAQITTNDLAKVKLHLIEYELLTGIQAKAADLDNDKDITINDLAIIKLELIK